MKTCSKCNRELPEECFHKRKYKNGKVATQSFCKECKARMHKIRYAKKRDEILEKGRLWRENNKEHMRELRKRWWENNPKTMAYYQALCRCRKEGTMPQDITREELGKIREFYMNCPEGYEVDHIVPRNPRQGQRGLHTIHNLQYLTPLENQRKSNKLTV